MIKFQATAKIHSISPIQEIPSKTGGQPFQKRELVLDDSYTKDGQTFQNFVMIEFTGDRMKTLDGFAPGQIVTVEGAINGRVHNDRIFNTVKGLSVSIYQVHQQAASAFPQQQAQYPQYPQQQGFGAQPNYSR